MAMLFIIRRKTGEKNLKCPNLGERLTWWYHSHRRHMLYCYVLWKVICVFCTIWCKNLNELFGQPSIRAVSNIKDIEISIIMSEYMGKQLHAWFWSRFCLNCIYMQSKMTRRKVINIHCSYLWEVGFSDYLLLYTFLYLSNIFSEHVFLLQLASQTPPDSIL